MVRHRGSAGVFGRPTLLHRDHRFDIFYSFLFSRITVILKHEKHKITLSRLVVKSFTIDIESEMRTVKGGVLTGHLFCFTANCEITKFHTGCC